MTLPPNFGRAFDLSGLGKPALDKSVPLPGIAVTPANLTAELLPLSAEKPVVVLCWSARSAESIEMLRTLGKLESESVGAWVLASVDIDTQPQVAQALQTRTIPYGLVFIAEQPIPFVEQALNESQLREVISKIMTLAAQQGVGAPPADVAEPEEDEALAAIDRGDFAEAERLYKSLLQRKPNDTFAKIGLAQVQLLARTEGLNSTEIAQAAAAAPLDLQLQMRAADMEIVIGELEQGFSRLITLISGLAGNDQKIAKERLLELFALVDPADPRVIKARTALANALF